LQFPAELKLLQFGANLPWLLNPVVLGEVAAFAYFKFCGANSKIAGLLWN
jgi:hypothetical protein